MFFDVDEVCFGYCGVMFVFWFNWIVDGEYEFGGLWYWLLFIEFECG